MLTDLLMLVYLTPSPLALVAEADRIWVLGHLRSMAGSSRTWLLAASPLYARIAHYQTGIWLEAVRPSSLHIVEHHRWRGGEEASSTALVWGMPGITSDFSIMAVRFFARGRRIGVPWLQKPTSIVFKDLAQGFTSWEF